MRCQDAAQFVCKSFNDSWQNSVGTPIFLSHIHGCFFEICSIFLPRSTAPVVEDESSHTSAMSDEEAPNSKNDEFSTDSEHNLTCCIFMLDILLKQMELQDVEQHMGIHTQVCQSVCRLLKCMVTAARVGVGSHVCAVKVKQVSECAYCEASIMWHQLSTKLVQFMAPENPIRPPDVSVQ